MEGSRIVSLWSENGRVGFESSDVVGVGVGILDSTIWMEREYFFLEKIYYYVLHITYRFFSMSMKNMQFQCLLHVLHITWCFLFS